MPRRALKFGDHRDLAGAVVERVQVGQWCVRVLLADGRELIVGCANVMSEVFAEVTGEEDASDAPG